MNRAKKRKHRGAKPPSTPPKKQRHGAGAAAKIVSVQQALVAFFILTLPVLLYIPNSEYGYTKTIYVYLIITLLYALWGIQAWLERKLALRLPVMWWPALALIGVGLFSLINATSPGIVLQSLGVFTYFFLFYFYIANTVRTPNTLCLYLGVGLLAALFASVYGWLQYYDLLPGLPGREGGQHAMISSMGNKNFLAEFLNIWIVPSLILLVGVRALWAKGLVLATTAMGFAALIAADSTGALLGFAASLLFFAIGLLALRSAARVVLRQKAWVAAWGLIILAAFVFVDKPGIVRDLFAVRQPDSAAPHAVLVSGPTLKAANLLQGPFDQLKDLIARYWEAGSGNTRAWDWWVAVEMLKAHPLVGVGLGHYKVRYVDYKTQFMQTERGQSFDFYIPRAAQAHNDYLQTTAELGLLGMGVIVFGLIVLVWSAARQLWALRGMRQLSALALTAGVVAFCVDAMVNFPAHLASSAFSVVLLIGLAHAPFLYAKSRTLQLKGVGLQLVVAVVLVATVGVTVFAYRDWQANIYLDEGNKNLTLGRYHLARESLEKSLDLDFAPAEVLFRLGVVHMALGEPEVAEGYFERSRNSFLVEEVLLPLASLKLQDEAYEAARALLDQLILNQPRLDLLKEAELLRAVIDIRDGHVDEGIAQLEALLEKYPRFEKVHYSLGEAAAMQGDRQQALRHYQDALDIIDAGIIGAQNELDRLQGQTVRTDIYARVRSKLERYTKLHEEVQATIEALTGRASP